ncbi:MAG TPA: hypothetical protein PKE03_10200 [Bacteroidales bacterium]|nr:hypothetical protein [Bacteroidales bacterium]
MSQDQLNLKITLEAFARIVIDEWEKKIEALGIGVTHQLIDSLYQHVHTNANGDPVRIEFTFNWYGKMVDYGVGNGVSLEERDSLIMSGSTSRRAKPWYTDVFYKQLERLRYILQDKVARDVEQMIVINLQGPARPDKPVTARKTSPSRSKGNWYSQYAKIKGRQ